MNLQQLEYIIAVDDYRNFAQAAEHCFVTQPTLSMMIKKLEDEFETPVFDRSKQPVIPTETGEALILQARAVIRESKKLKEILHERMAKIEGDFNMGIIPTLGPYIIPLFLKSFTTKYPLVNLNISEHTTEVLVDKLIKGTIDVALLVTPLNNKSIIEIPVFYEEFFVYSFSGFQKNFILPEDINPDELWLLEEGHCLRSQIVKFCELRKKTNTRLNFRTGSLEMLKQLVRNFRGMTILPELATLNLSDEEKNKLGRFISPHPVREVSLALHRNFIKKRHVEALKEVILENLPSQVKTKQQYHKIEIE